ncbi:MAG: hypothetical protein LOX97_00950 [Sphingomonas sp.]|nr:hypothetical protein [Sphingomonas sp.]
MAKAKKASEPKAKKKSAKGGKSRKAEGAKPSTKAASSGSGTVDALWKIADHPLVGELIAIGASAAVAAIAQQNLGAGKKQGSGKAVKEAGKAAAAAIGARLISEYAGQKSAKKTSPSKA